MFETIIDAINTFLYSKLLIVILIGSGIYFTVRTRFPQVRLFKNTDGLHGISCRDRQHCRSIFCHLYRWCGLRILDVDHCHSWKRISSGREHTGADI